MQVIRIPLANLVPAPYNPRVELKPDDPRLRKLRRSLKQFGLVEPLIWNERTNHVVGGHQRLRILKELGWTEVDVSVVNLDDDQEKALNIVLNNREAQGDFDPLKLRDLLEELEQKGKLQATAFTPSHLQILRDDLTPAATRLPELDDLRPQWWEIVLHVPDEQMEMVRASLDPLIDHFALEVHVRSLK